MEHAESVARVRRHYDDVGDAEWGRLDRDVAGRVSFEVHRRFLRRFVPPGSRVLEIGAGPGRFTAELAELGCQVLVTDLSQTQLDAHARRLEGTPAERAVERRELLDVCDTAHVPNDSYHVVLAYGGPLSYTFDRVDDALAGLLRIIRPDGVLLASVMSLLGTWRHLLPAVTELAEAVGEDANDAALRTGDLRHVQPDGDGHVCRMFRADEIRTRVADAGGRVEAVSASNWASLGDPDTLARIEVDPDRWQRFLDHEVDACGRPGALDGGTHIIIAGQPRRRP